MRITFSIRTSERSIVRSRDLALLSWSNRLVLVVELPVTHTRHVFPYRRRNISSLPPQTQWPSLSNNAHEFHTFLNETAFMVSIGGLRDDISDI